MTKPTELTSRESVQRYNFVVIDCKAELECRPDGAHVGADDYLALLAAKEQAEESLAAAIERNIAKRLENESLIAQRDALKALCGELLQAYHEVAATGLGTHTTHDELLARAKEVLK